MAPRSHLAVSFDVSSEGCPERHLIAAVLEQAIYDCKPVRTRQCTRPAGPQRKWQRKHYHKQLRLLREQALAWVFRNDDPDGNRKFSFPWCCQALGYSPAYLRRRISATLRGNLTERHLWINFSHKWSASPGRAS